MHGTRDGDLRRTSERLSQLLERAERVRLANLGFDELRELGRLYRLSAAHLASLRDRGDDPDEIRHVNSLCVRAFGVLYGRRGAPVARPSTVNRLREALARTWRAQVIAWLLLLAGCLVGAGLVHRDPVALAVLVPASLGYSAGGLEQLASSPEARSKFLARETKPAGPKVLFGSSLFVRNTSVGLLSFATGMLAGVPTVLLQIFNGLIVGALSAVFLRDPTFLAYLAWILPHAIPEMTALTLCAAGGLLLGGAVVAPGRGGRAAALRNAVDPALLLFAGSLPMFLIAAAIESFARESTLDTLPRLAIAAVCGISLLLLYVFAHRLAPRRRTETAWLADLSVPTHTAAGGSD